MTIATVFGMAKAAGYVPPTRQQKTMSAVEAFQIPNPSLNQPDAPQDGVAVPDSASNSAGQSTALT